MPQLLTNESSAPRCAYCSAEAVGPCARCSRMVCGDCCVLTEGGVKAFAVCNRCERNGGRSLSRAWLDFGAWIVAIILLLALVAWLIRQLQ